MAYNGSIDLISGIRQKNNGTFPLVDAKDVRVTDQQRLDAALAEKMPAASALPKPEEAGEAGQVLKNGEDGATVWGTIGADEVTVTEGKKLDAVLNEKADADDVIPKPAVAGTEGQHLEIDANGDPVWLNPGTPTDTQVGDAVNAWLTAHPEATTTVQDGSITRAKLDDDLKEKTDEVSELKSAIKKYNAYAYNMGYNKTTETSNDVTYTWNASNNVCHVQGTASGNSINVVNSNYSSLFGITPGDQVTFHLDSTGGQILGVVYVSKNGASITWLADLVPGVNEITIPSDAVGMRVDLRVPSGRVIDEDVEIYITNAHTNKMLTEESQSSRQDIKYLQKENPYLSRVSNAFAAGLHTDDSVITIFAASEVTTGETIYYRISLESADTSHNAYIELLDANNERLAIYGKTSISTADLVYSGSFTIPSGFAKAVYRGTSKVAYLDYVGTALMPNIAMSVIKSDINGLDEVVGAKNISAVNITGVGVDATAGAEKTVAAGKYAIILPVDNTDVKSFTIKKGSSAYYTDTKDATYGWQIGLKYIVFTLESVTTLTFMVACTSGIVSNFTVISNPDVNALASYEAAENNRESINALRGDSLKEAAGIIAYNVKPITPYDCTGLEGVHLFSDSDVAVNDVLSFCITVPSYYTSGNCYIETRDANNDRIAIYGKTSSAASEQTKYTGTITITAETKSAVLRGTNGQAVLEYLGYNCMPVLLEGSMQTLSEAVEDIQDQVTANVTLVDDAFFDIPIETGPDIIFSNDDATAVSGVDGGLLNLVNVVKISDSMYYMYYEAFDTSASHTDFDTNLCFAYSADGLEFTKGYPQGITPPSVSSNVLMTGVHGSCVVRVNDSDYPFRLIGLKNINDSAYTVCIYKSQDGVNWTYIRAITAGGNDSPVSCVVRGNTLKIFVRSHATVDSNSIRTIGIICTDLDGNRYYPHYGPDAPAKTCISSNDYNAQFYQASASVLDDRREILFPTIYNPADSSETVGCYILDGNYLKKINITTIGLIRDQKSVYIGCGVVNIGLYDYVYYTTRSTDHEHTVIGTTKSYIKRAKVVIH